MPQIRNSFGYRQMVLPLGKVSLIVHSHFRKRMCQNQEHGNSDVGWVEKKSTNDVDAELFLDKARWSRWLRLRIVIWRVMEGDLGLGKKSSAGIGENL